ncbi:MAG: HisJ family histidinol phosphate phosphatase [Rhodothermales bacterium]|jgi:HisJ family histidinol phosphate phosphatase
MDPYCDKTAVISRQPRPAPTPMMVDSHMHTPLCKHAIGEPEEYAQVGFERGLAGITFTCHCPMPPKFAPEVRMADKEFKTYLRIVDRARNAWDGRIEVRLGLESDYFPGYEPWLEKLHARADFHYILGSVHPQFLDWRKTFYDGDAIASQRIYFEQLADAAETGLFDCLAHPDLIKYLFPNAWDYELVMDSICDSLDRIAKTGVAMELNTSGLYKSIREMSPSENILEEIASRDIPVVLGSDSHTPARVSDRFLSALGQLTRLGFDHVWYFHERQAQALKISDVMPSLYRTREVTLESA